VSFRGRRADNDAEFDIGWSGKFADPSAASNFSGTTCLVTKIYAQKNTGTIDAIQTTKSKMIQALIDTDGQWSFQGVDSCGLEVADNVIIHPAKVHMFMLLKPGYTPDTGDGFCTFGYMEPSIPRSVTGAANNGSGLVRLTVSSTTGWATGQTKTVENITWNGSNPANGTWTITVVDGTHIDLQGSSFSGSYNSGGTVTGYYWHTARYGFGLDFGNSFQAPLNGQTSGFESARENTIGQGHRGDWRVWDYSTNTLALRVDKVVRDAGTTTADVSYPRTGKLMFFCDADYQSQDTYLGKARDFTMYNATQTSGNRDSISQAMIDESNGLVVTLPTSFSKTIAGSTYTVIPDYQPTFNRDAPDVNNIKWWHEYGGYKWPSYGAVQSSNSIPCSYFQVRTNDTDTIVTGAERAERGGFLGSGEDLINKGEDFARYFDFTLKTGGNVASGTDADWGLIGQIHYDNGAGSPDIFFIDCRNGVFQVTTQRNGVDTQRGSSVSITEDTWYSCLVKGTWSSGGSADTLEVWLWPHGATAAKIVNITTGSQLFDTAGTTAYTKEGWYSNLLTNRTIEHVVANHKYSATKTAFDSLLTSFTTLPVP
jgi:hypothetical protein